MHKFAEICVRRPVFASVIILMLVVVGVFSYFQLGVDRYPYVEFPLVVVTTIHPGAAPEEIETEITEKIEEAVNTISGIDQLISTSSESVSVVVVQFVLDKEADVAAQEVRDRLNRILAELPGDADPPLIEKVDSTGPVLAIALSGPAGIRDLSEFADKTLRRQIESVEGVGQVRVLGDRPRQINVVVDPAKLASLELTVAHLVGALRAQNVQIPGGRVEQGSRNLTLRTYGRVTDPAELAEIAVLSRNGYTIKVGDVARVEDTTADVKTAAIINGDPAVVLSIRKQSGTNSIAVVANVKDRLEDLRRQLPEGWRLTVERDRAKFILDSIRTVQEHLVVGSILAVLVVLLFLKRWRPTIISAIAIPSSIVASFGAMYYLDFTLNMLTLLALTLAVGIVIDDAVVVLENIFRFMEEKKMSPFQAAVEGTREVGLAVMATSFSLVAVFLPVAFMGGLVGRFMKSFGLTMAFAVLVSLLVSFTVTPMLAARWLRPSDLGGEKGSKSGLYGLVEALYMRILGWSMRHRWVIAAVILATLGSTVPLVQAVNKNFLPFSDESRFEIIVRTAEGTNVEVTGRILESIAERVRGLDPVEGTLVTVGDDQQGSQNQGLVYVRLKELDERREDQYEVMDQVRQEILPHYAELGLRTQVAKVPTIAGGGNNSMIQFWVGGRDLERLSEYADVLMAKLTAMPGIVDADTNYVDGNPELRVRLDRAKAADLGVRVADVATTLNVLVGGAEVTDYFEAGEQYEVHVRADERDRRDVRGIARVEVPSSKLGTVRISDVVTIEEGTGPSVVNHIDRRRQILLYANLLPGYSQQTVIDSLVATAEELEMPPGYTYGLAGQSEEQGKAAKGFALAFGLSFAFMYLILAAQFESWIHPVTILLALPLTVPFALVSILVLNGSLNIFSSLGIVVLFGIVKKNGILQVDHMNGLRAKGMPRLEAILEANRDRLRPILMTTLAFVAGMIPLVVSSGSGAAINRAIGTVIIGGQSLALLLTLLATPVVYSIFDDWANARVWKWLFRAGAKPAVPAEAPATGSLSGNDSGESQKHRFHRKRARRLPEPPSLRV